ncbi:MAG: phosphoesterase PA-phosphatase related protein [Actinomycetia bacterium]|nr:phosphoesterase PA-phosphatase related protein [Actinomycetes bacterium]
MSTSELLPRPTNAGIPGDPVVSPAVDSRPDRRLQRRRWLIAWLVAVVVFVIVIGVPTSRPQIFVIICLGLIASSVGTDTNWKRVIIDFLPFYAVLALYDFLRASAGKWLEPHALPQIRIDQWLFGGTVPTVRLQRALYTPGVAHIWDYASFAVYMTHFIVPFVVAGLLWKYQHDRFYRYTALFVGLTFSAFVTYAIYPAVPPWMASQNGQIQPTSKIIDEMWTHIGLSNGSNVFSGAGHFANPVAAVPSLHAAYTMLIVLFFWKGAKRWRPLLVLYPLGMAFALVYTGEHYVIDILLGWAYAATVFVVGSKAFDTWQSRDAAAASITESPPLSPTYADQGAG